MAELATTVRLGDDEDPLMVFVVTTYGMHFDPQPALTALNPSEQAFAIRVITQTMRKAADQLEARAGLVETVEEAMRP